MMSYRTAVLFIFLITTVALQQCKSQNLPSGDTIRLNQIGFYPEAPKHAVLEKDISGSFYLTGADKRDTVFTGILSEAMEYRYGNRTVRLADFTSFKESGEYRVLVPGLGYSYPFEIKNSVHEELADAVIKGFYFQRASTALPEQYAGKWQRAAGHPDDSVLVHSSAASDWRPEGTVISSSGGWYDAGDYNKYIVNSGITMGTLFSLYEDFPEYSKSIELDIPERANSIPDLLDEALWNLRWMMTMQDPTDGGVYHKMTSANFSGTVMPDEDTDVRYVVQKSTAATLDFAAVMAQAARIFSEYKRQVPGLADSCLSAAEDAWEWAQSNPKVFFHQRELNNNFDPDITTGAYGDRNVQDEFIWAAAELFVTTGNESYLQTVDMTPGEEMSLPSWGNVQALGYYTLLRFRDKYSETADEELLKIENMLVDFANLLVEGGSQSAYRTVMGSTENNFIWGSNSVAANQSIALIQAYELTSDIIYLDYALSNLDYLMGRNGTGFAFVTGYGDKSPMNPHHRPSGADGIEEPVPGLLAGGPNPGQQDPCSYPSDIPDQSYIDDYCSYASNEIAINWNAPIVYVAAAIEALQYDAGYSVR